MSEVHRSPAFPTGRRVLVPSFIVTYAAVIVLIGGFNTLISDTSFSMGLDPEAGSARSQLISGAFYVYFAYYLAIHPRTSEMLRSAWPALLIPALALVSAVWSPDPFLTLRRSVSFFGVVIVGLSIGVHFGLRGCVTILIRALCLSSLLSVLFALLVPSIGVHQLTDKGAFQPEHAGSWRGIFPHRSALGGMIAGPAVAFLLVFGRTAIRNPLLCLGGLAASAACVVEARSGAGYLAAATLPLVGWGGVALVASGRRLDGSTVLVALFVLAVFGFFAQDALSVILEVLDKKPDFTGRVPYWEALEGVIEQRWLLGYGYFAGYAILVAPQMESTVGTAFVNAHNGFMELLVGMGVVGLLAGLFYLAFLFRKSFNLIAHGGSRHGSAAAFPLVFILFSVGSNVIESSISEPSTLVTVGLAMIAGVRLVGSPADTIRPRCRNRRLRGRPRSG